MTARGTTRNIITRAILFLIAGAIVNVAVAWAIAGFVHPHAGVPEYWADTDQDGQIVFVSSFSGFGRKRVSHHSATPIDPNLPLTHPFVNNVRWTGGSKGAIDYVGWPWHALSCVNSRDTIVIRRPQISTSLPGDPTAKVEGGIEVSPFETGPGVGATWRALPFYPLWGGLAFNTAFFALVCWMSHRVARSVLGAARSLAARVAADRAHRRIKRGLCPACAYPVGSNQLCTECGERVKSTSRDREGAV